MTHSSLSRVIVFVPALVWACAHQVDDFPEQLEGDDAQAVGKAGASATAGGGLEMPGPTATGGSVNVAQAGGTSAGGTRTYTPTGGQSGKAGGGGAGSSVALPPSEEGGAATEQGGAAGADAGSGGGDTGGSAGHAGSASGGSSSASAGSASGGSSAVGACSGVAKWSAGTYAPGARVQNGVNLYQCKPHPYSGWCGLDAYAPGSGWAWTDAWTIVGPC